MVHAFLAQPICIQLTWFSLFLCGRLINVRVCYGPTHLLDSEIDADDS